jgi:ubiquitin-protein ligase
MNKRIEKEMRILYQENQPNIVDIDEVNNNILITLRGPEGSKYEDNIYEISINFPSNYPFRPPKINFNTPIDFPLFNVNGTVDLFSLFGKDYDTSIYIKDIIERIIFFMSPVETRIDTYKNKTIRYTFEKKPITPLIEKALGHSFGENKELAFVSSNVPVLIGFYTAHCNHLPIKIKPDDIWLLIVQGFINHVNENSEKLRHLFVNFDGKQELKVEYYLSDISQVNKSILEDFAKEIVKQITNYIGKELIDILSPNFTTTTFDSEIICKISIIGAFKHYFNYKMLLMGCGVPYVVLDGTADDYKKILEKAKKLKKYDLDWYIDRIIPHIEKMIEAKEGLIDKEYFKNMIQSSELVDEKRGPSGMKVGEYQVDALSGWFLSFFSYIKSECERFLYKFNEKSIKIKDFYRLTNQIIEVPFELLDKVKNIKYHMNFKVGFAGCDKNEKNEVFPVQGWWAKEDR